MKVALVHDYLREYGGAERVVEALHEIWPDAPIYTAYYDPSGLGTHGERIKKWDIRTSWFQKFPLAGKLVSPFRVFAPMMFESFDLSEYDIVISSCAIYFSKAVITKPEAFHLSYIHTPPRYLYGYTTSFNYKKNPITRILGELANHILRIYDFETSQRPDILIANSENVKKRINKFYRREPVIIYPPVTLPVIASPKGVAISIKSRSSRRGVYPAFSGAPQDDKKYFLSVGRLVRGKGIDIIIEACTKLDLPLKVVGAGPEIDNLKKVAGKSIEFVGQLPDDKLPETYSNAIATIVASEDEDFGIVPVESMAFGTPVIAVRAGGFLETVIEGKTGLFFDKATLESLMEVLQKFDGSKFKAEDCKKQAEKFSKERFKKEILKLVEDNFKQVGF